MYVHPDEGGDGVRVDQEHRSIKQLGHYGQQPFTPRVVLLLKEGGLGKVHHTRVR